MEQAPNFADEVQKKRQVQQQEAQGNKKHSDVIKATDAIQAAVIGSAKANIQHRDQHEPKVDVKNMPKDYAKDSGVKEAVDAINKLNLTTSKGLDKLSTQEQKETDLSPLIEAVNNTTGTIASLRFPVPNYVLPFKDPSGKDVQVQLDASGNIPTLANTSGLIQTRANYSDQNTTITSSVAATTIVTADATHYLDLVSLTLTNISATATEVTLYNDDGTTVRWSGYVPAGDMRGIVFSTPFTQTAVNKSWQLKTVTSIASLKVTAQFVKNS